MSTIQTDEGVYEVQTKGVFETWAPYYWNAGLPVIPLLHREKLPAVAGWQHMQSRMPTDEEQAEWLRAFPNGNVGMPLGPQSGLIALDIDTEDSAVLAVLDKVMPPSPWLRIGHRGSVKVYRYDGQPTFRIKDRAGGSICEMLSIGAQIVLPPSIHPKTGQPYYANKDLVEVLDQLFGLPTNIQEILHQAFRDAGIECSRAGTGPVTQYISPGNRDNKLVSHAGMYARDVIKGHITLREGLDHMIHWVENFAEKVHGDMMDPQKGPQKLVEFLIRDVTGPKKLQLKKGWDDGLDSETKERLGLSIFSEDHEKWSSTQILDHFNAQLEKTGVKDSPDHFMTLADAVIVKLAASKEISNLEEDRVIRYIAEASGKLLTVQGIRKQLGKLRQGDIEGTDQSQIAEQVRKELEEIKGEIRFHDGQLWQWVGSHWEVMEEHEVLKHLAQEYGHYVAAKKFSDHVGVMKILRNLCKSELVRRDVVGINFVNGFLTETLDLLPHDPDFGMTYCLPYAYEPEKAGKCGKWLKMLSDYWADDEDYAEKVEALRQAMAVTMFGTATKTQTVFALYGVSHSGKSQVLDVMRELMPPGCSAAIPPTDWKDKFAPAQLAGKLLNMAGELSETQLIDAAKFKTITVGERISAQHKGMPLFEFQPKCAHWFATNHLPKTKDSSDGFTRRWIFFEFTKKFPVEVRVFDYALEVAAEEREAIAAWVVQGITDVRNNRYKIKDPKSSVRVRTHLENQLNNVLSFLKDLRESGRLLMGVQDTANLPRNITTLETLWTEYRSFCVSTGVSPVGLKIFVDRMAQLQGTFGFQMERGQTDLGFSVNQYRYLTFVARAGA